MYKLGEDRQLDIDIYHVLNRVLRGYYPGCNLLYIPTGEVYSTKDYNLTSIKNFIEYVKQTKVFDPIYIYPLLNENQLKKLYGQTLSTYFRVAHVQDTPNPFYYITDTVEQIRKYIPDFEYGCDLSYKVPDNPAYDSVIKSTTSQEDLAMISNSLNLGNVYIERINADARVIPYAVKCLKVLVGQTYETEGHITKENTTKLVKGKFDIGDIIVAIVGTPNRPAGSILKVQPLSTTTKLYHDLGNSTYIDEFRLATKEEVEAYDKGIRHLNDMNTNASVKSKTEIKVLNEYEIGDIVVSLGNYPGLRQEGDLFEIEESSTNDTLDYFSRVAKRIKGSSNNEAWRKATDREAQMFRDGIITNIVQIPIKQDVTGSNFAGVLDITDLGQVNKPQTNKVEVTTDFLNIMLKPKKKKVKYSTQI